MGITFILYGLGVMYMKGLKCKNIDNIRYYGYNVHKYEVCRNIDELKAFTLKNPISTLRFDKVSGNIMGLPFYDLTTIPHTDESLRGICELADEMDCSLLCLSAKQHDKDMICNFVCKVDRDMSFVIEYSTELVPLRHMYRYTTEIVRGNLLNNKHSYTYITKEQGIPQSSGQKGTKTGKISLYDIEHIIDLAFKNGGVGIGKWLEGSIYKVNVGVNNEDYVIWQIAKG